MHGNAQPPFLRKEKVTRQKSVAAVIRQSAFGIPRAASPGARCAKRAPRRSKIAGRRRALRVKACHSLQNGYSSREGVH
jgi:hypothetical protein